MYVKEAFSSHYVDLINSVITKSLLEIPGTWHSCGKVTEQHTHPLPYSFMKGREGERERVGSLFSPPQGERQYGEAILEF